MLRKSSKAQELPDLLCFLRGNFLPFTLSSSWGRRTSTFLASKRGQSVPGHPAPRRAALPPRAAAVRGALHASSPRCPPQTFNSASSDVNLGGGAQVKFNMLSWGSFI